MPSAPSLTPPLASRSSRRFRWPLAINLPLTDGQISLAAYESSDAEELFVALDDERVWEHIPSKIPHAPQELDALLRAAIERGRVTLTIRDGDVVVGTTSVIWDAANPTGVEVGGTRMSPTTWGSGLNGRTKDLLITALFAAGAEWIRFRTDERNTRSAAAILKLGAVEIGIKPDKRVRRDGSRRNSRFFELRPPTEA